MRTAVISRAKVSAAALAIGLFMASAAFAQPVTAIIPDTAPGLSTGTVVGSPRPMPFPAPTTVEISGGTRLGDNLFHSFQRFDVGRNVSAVWTGDAATSAQVRAIINRVTGGDPSDIHGGLDSTFFPNADLYFINPAGIVFGEGARIDTGGAFYASTANALVFADSARFEAVGGGGSSLTTAPPASFGFLPGGSGDIAFTGNPANPTAGPAFIVRDGRPVHFSAANISLDNIWLAIDESPLRLIAVGSGAADIAVDHRSAVPDLAGRVTVTDSFVLGRGFGQALRGEDAAVGIFAGDLLIRGSASLPRPSSILVGGITVGPATTGGDLVVRADRVMLEGHAHLGAATNSPDAPYLVSIDARSLVSLTGGTGQEFRTLIGSSSGNAEIRIFGANATLRIIDAMISAGVGGGTVSGSIDINVGEIIGDGARLNSIEDFFTSGAAVGSITLAARLIDLRNSRIDTYTFRDRGGGNVSLTAADILFVDTNIQTATAGSGNAGSILLSGQRIRLEGSILSSDTGGDGQGGDLTIRGGNVQLIDSNLGARTSGGGHGGAILVSGTDVLMEGGEIATNAASSGNAGNIAFRADTLTIRDILGIVEIESGTGGSGSGGAIEFEARQRASITNAFVTAATNGAGSAGQIIIRSPELLMLGGRFETSTSGIGDGGGIRLLSDNADIRFSVFNTATSGLGAAGDIDLAASSRLTLSLASLLSLSDRNAGPAGSVRLTAADLELLGSNISATTQSGSRAGDISATGSRTLSIVGGTIENSTLADGNAGMTTLNGGSVLIERAHVLSVTSARGTAGSIQVAATNGSVTLRDAQLRSDASGTSPAPGQTATGGAGNILVQASDDISLQSASLTSTATGLAARAGSIELVAGDRIDIGIVAGLGIPAAISVTTASAAPLGDQSPASISLRAATISVVGDAQRAGLNVPGRVTISSTTTGVQRGGDVTIVAERDLLLRRADVSAQTTNLAGQPLATGNAGNLNLRGTRVLLDNAYVEAASNQSERGIPGSAGDAGAITVVANDELLLDNRSVISSAASGTGAAGSVDVTVGRLATIRGVSRIDTDISGNARRGGDVRIRGANALLRIEGQDPTDPDQFRSVISSSTGNSQSGGSVSVDVRRVELSDGGGILADSVAGASGAGGNIRVTADSFFAEGALSGLQATALGTGDAGSITLTSNAVMLSNGARISTDARQSAAGNIEIHMPSSGLLELRGRDSPVFITTSSLPGEGGRIFISAPLAIISDGGQILALNEAQSANAQITTGFLIRSADRLNLVAVDGQLLFDAQTGDVSEGTDEVVFETVDPFGILISQCGDTRNSGSISQLGVSLRGPYVARATPSPQASLGGGIGQNCRR